MDAVACGERVRDHVPGMAIALFSRKVGFWQLLLLPPLSRRSSCRAGDGVLSRLRADGSKSSVAHAHPQFSGPLFPRGKARARAPKNQRQPLQNPGKSSRSWSRKGHVASIEAAIRALGSNPEPTVLASFKEALQKAKDIKEPKPAREAVSRSPDEVRADAVARVASLEAAIAAFEDHHDQAQKSLEEALAKAKKSANVAPVV